LNRHDFETINPLNCMNNRGDALIMTMIMMGVSIVMVAGVFAGILNVRRMNKDQALRSIQSQSISNIRNILTNSNICKAAYTGVDLTPSITNTAASATLSPMTMVAPIPLNGANITLDGTFPEVAPGIQFVSMSFRKKTNVAASVDVAGTSYSAYDGEALIKLRKTNPDLFFRDYKDVVVPLQVAIDPANKIVSCAFHFNEADACKKMNGIWRPLAAPGTKCIQANSCVTVGSYANTGSDPAGFTNPYTGGYNCPPGYQARQKGVIQFPYDSGKYGVGMRSYAVHECSYCLDGNGDIVPSNTVLTSGDTLLDFSDLADAFSNYILANGGFSLF